MCTNRLSVEELQERANGELKEDPTRRGEDIEALRQWVIEQPHIRGRTDDAFLLQFLRNCKFSLEHTKKKIDNFYTSKTKFPEYFSDCDPRTDYMLRLLKLGGIIPLGYDHEGRRIVIVRFGVACSNNFTVEDCMRLFYMFFTHVLSDEQTQICGVSLLLDYTDIDLKFVRIFTPMNIKKAMFVCQDCFPVRLRHFTVFNAGKIFNFIYAIVKLFLKKKLIARIRIVGGKLESIYPHSPADCLPTEYGGTAGDIQYFIDKAKTDLLDMRNYFLEDENYFVDESCRIKQPSAIPDDHFESGRIINVD